VLQPYLSSTWLPPDSLTVLMLHLQTSHVDCTRMLTAVLVLHFSCSCRLSRACCTSGQLHTILHFTAAAAATTDNQLFCDSHGQCTSEIISCSIHCCCYCCGPSTPGLLLPATSCIHTLADHFSGRKVPQSTSLIVCRISTWAGTICVCYIIQVLQQLSIKLLLPSKRCL
jgi:hypothetical protein